MTTQEKTKEIWEAMNESERTGVRFGMFPLDKMQPAEEEGYDGKELCVALMDVAKQNGGMRA